MTDTLQRPAPDPRPATRRRSHQVAAAVVLGLLLVVAGYLVGVRSPWTHHPHVVSGVAQRVPADVPLGYLDRDGKDRITFRLDDVVWRSGNTTDDHSVPPCLRDAGSKVTVQAGVVEVARPFGSGSYWKVLSVTCPSR